MSKYNLKKFLIIISFFYLSFSSSYSEILKNVVVKGNDRISTETIIVFSSIKLGDEINNDKINEIINALYNTKFFENISTRFENQILTIEVKENPIINIIEFKGVKSNTLKDEITKNIELKPRSSFNIFLLEKDKSKILNELKNRGYYNAVISTFTEKKDNNTLDLVYDINIGNKSKIKRIIFTGNKIYKDKKLKSIIISEEYKFWKFISGKKYLNENIVSFDKRLLKNFYQNQGYVNVEINTSFAKSLDKENFELIFNVNANEKIFFNNFNLDLPDDFDATNFKKINNLFNSLKGQPYSINRIDKILKTLKDITIYEQYVSSDAYVEENIYENKIDLKFIIKETDKIFIDKINIFGNNVTKESVIRNQLELDEGDPFNEILFTRSINNLKSLNFFKDVKTEIIDNNDEETNTLIINVE